MRTQDFNYDLPEELIAQEPAEPRDSCRLEVLHRSDGSVEHKVFTDIKDYVRAGDLLVLNRTRVLPARLLGHKTTGAQAEVFLLTRRDDVDASGNTWECLVRPGKRLKEGAVVEFTAPDDDKVILTGTIVGHAAGGGERLVRLEPEEGLSLSQAVHLVGQVPLPPYITKYTGDPEKYQNVFSDGAYEGSVAAPTAGLHFTPELLGELAAMGINQATVELEVGLGTFRSVTVENLENHEMHMERYSVSQETIDAITQTRERGGRVIAVGTTSVRSLESAWDEAAGKLLPRDHDETRLFLTPGSAFHAVDCMLTNFHVPMSTLMMLVSAFASRDQIMEAYAQAVDNKYRMLSFGDAMFID